jgi:hypothetical protein
MKLSSFYLRVFFIATSLIVNYKSNGQCDKKLIEVSLYKVPIYKLYYNGLGVSDVIKIVENSRNDSTITISVTKDVSAIDSLISNNRCIRPYLCEGKKCNKTKFSMDIRHVFAFKYSDSTTFYIGLSSVRGLMMLNDDVYKRDKRLINELYKHFN